jgi:glycosyltransferase involved in cell wall biosynthesis
MTVSNMPLVSIVTPSYNAAAFIRETIESVRGQDYPAIEHIVMDGGSTDGTVDILQEYPHLIWVSERDHGQSDALNKGFRRARGEVIGWLNADDTYESGALRTAVDHLQARPEAGGVYGECRVIDGAGRFLHMYQSRPFNLRTLLLECYICQPALILRRQAIEVTGAINVDLDYVMDWEYFLRIGARFPLVYLPGVTLASFRAHESNKTVGRPWEFDIEWLRVLDEAFQRPPFRDLAPWWRWRAKRLAWARHYMATAFAAHRTGDRAKIRRVLPRGVYYNPAWLFNRGTLAMGAQAFAADATLSRLRHLIGRSAHG